MKYAAQTTVSSEKSRLEIENTLNKYGATEFQYGRRGSVAVIVFGLSNRLVRMELKLPDKSSKEFTHTPGRGLERSQEEVEKAYEQAIRQRWRALALVVKAKLEAVESGISTVEQEFMAWVVVPGTGKTVGELAAPQLEAGYNAGMPTDLKLLPSG